MALNLYFKLAKNMLLCFLLTALLYEIDESISLMNEI